MITIPEPDEVLRDLSHLLTITYSALDYGTYQSLSFFENHKDEADKRIDPFLGPHLVRFYAKKALIKDSNGYFRTENIANSGLFIYNEKYNLRIKKSDRGKLPAPGHSISRQQYYRQMPINLPEFKEYQSSDKLNLLILWNLDPEEKYRIGSLSLACPKDGGVSSRTVVAYWHVFVPYGILTGTGDTILPGATRDLPLTFSIDEETGDDF
jgi:hypothetical protein